MLANQLVRLCFSASKFFLAVLLLSATLATGSAQAISQGERYTNEIPSNVPIVKKTNSNVATGSRGLSNGTYMYGETNEPGAVGREYVVFDHQGGQAIGAVFMAGSEYSCFSGQVQGDRLQMMVLDSYENAERPYDISLEGQSSDGYEYRPVHKIGQQEMNILDTCRSFYRERFSSLSIRG
jgi:hypothetical protein